MMLLLLALAFPGLASASQYFCEEVVCLYFTSGDDVTSEIAPQVIHNYNNVSFESAIILIQLEC